MNLTTLDRIIGQLFPGWAMRRIRTRMAFEALSTYAAADQGRRNRDWRPPVGSADLAIIPDSETLNKRARALVRDSSVARSILRSWSRNVVGRGIMPIPLPVGAGGEEMTDLAHEIEREFDEWASRPDHCDTERRCTFWGMQSRAIEEMVTVGEAFFLWRFENTPGQVGLRLQSVEPEQLVTDSSRNATNGNEIRGGVEVDADGAAVAYWFYDANPADYLPGTATYRRVPRANVIHLFRPERVRQTRGVSWLAPVMQRIRDYHRRDDAEMWASIIEACIGLIVTRNYPTALGASPTLPRESDDTGQTASGLRTADFVPGMIFEGQMGEEVKPFTPNRPAGSYEPYIRMNLRQIGAGTGLSYEQIARDFTGGSYSSQRQGLLEDLREFRPVQDLVIHGLVLPVYELWVKFAAIAGVIAIDPAELARDTRRYVDADFVSDGHDWIDPLKEVQAQALALEQKLTTRKEIISSRGGRLRRTWEQLAEEQRLAEELDIELPESKPPAPPPAAQPQDQPADDAENQDDAPDEETNDGNGNGDGQDLPAANVAQ